MSKEIERKFLAEELPEDLERYPNKKIEQFYTEISEDCEVRYRREGNKFYCTEKGGRGISREENEREIAEEEYKKAFESSVGIVEKTRYEIPLESSAAELDIYHAELNGLITVEVEFDSEEDAKEFTEPSWFGREITKEEKYKNKNLATK